MGTITVVRPGGTTASAKESLFNRRILADGSGVTIDGSAHTHASLDALVAFYQDPGYFATSVKVDVPVKLLFPSQALYAEVNPDLFWREPSGGGSAAASLAGGEMVYGDVNPHGGDGAGAGQQGGIYEELSAVLEKLWNVMDDIEKNLHGVSVAFADSMATLHGHRHCKVDLVAKGREALAYARRHAHVGTVQRAGAAALNADDIAAIYMYTMDTDFFARLNEELGGYNRGKGRKAIEHFLPYTKLLVSALDKLPPVTMTLFRGSTMDYEALLRGGIQVNDQASWNQFTSCSTSPSVLKQDAFLGEMSAGTVFQVVAVAGVDIEPYSAIPTEKEVLLPAGSKFVLDKISRKTKHGVIEIRMRQLLPERERKK